jgi:hypothetical protein
MSASQALAEKRLHPRATVELPLSCETAAGAIITGVARDLGIGGMFVESSEPPAYAAEIVVVTRLPGMKTDSRLPAIVRWLTDRGFGVQFGALGARDTFAISALLKY